MKEEKWKRTNKLMGKNIKKQPPKFRVNKSRGGSSQKRSG
jgi:hypothetical protein